MKTKDIFKQLDSAGFTFSGHNYDDELETDLVGERITKAKCFSLQCTGDKTGLGPGVRKLTKKDDCPDCGHALVWEAYRV